MALVYYSGKKGEYGNELFTNTTATTYAAGDALKLASGKLAPVAAGTDPIAAIAETGVTAAAAGTTNTVNVPTPGMKFKIQTDDASAASAANIGKYANLTGASGSMKLDHTSIVTTSMLSTTAATQVTIPQLIIDGVNPDGDDASVYLVRVWNAQLVR